MAKNQLENVMVWAGDLLNMMCSESMHAMARGEQQ